MDYFTTWVAPPQPKEFNNDKLTLEEEATVWWIVLFTYVFQTLHKVPARAMEWLLKFLGVFYFLGKFADPIKQIASHLPNTNYLRVKYIYKNKLYRQKSIIVLYVLNVTSFTT